MSEQMSELHFTLNGKPVSVCCDPTRRFLDVLREDLRLTGTKEGCGVGECGACTIVIGAQAQTACLVLAGQVDGQNVMTVEGLSESEIGNILQVCFVDEGAVQCGYCTPGMLMSAYALLLRNAHPTKEEIRLAMSGNLCRCTGYVPILKAIEKAAAQLPEQS